MRNTKIKRLLTLLCAAALALPCFFVLSACKEKKIEKKWWEDTANIVIRYTDPTADPEIIDIQLDVPGTASLTYVYDGLIHEPMVRMLYKGEHMIYGTKFSTEYFNTEKQQWQQAVGAVNACGNYRLSYNFYASKNVNVTGDTCYITIIEKQD